MKQNTGDSNYSRLSSDLSLDEEREALRRETERQALAQLEKARVCLDVHSLFKSDTFIPITCSAWYLLNLSTHYHMPSYTMRLGE